ncbi:MAG: leucine-rich repeat domain-containing protein [Promethearchaeota archaeon]
MKEMVESIINLKIKEAYNEDIEKLVVRIDPIIEKELNLKMGNIVLIHHKLNKKNTAGLLYPGKEEDSGEFSIRMNESLRNNIGANIGEEVEIKKIEVKNAQGVTLGSAKSSKFVKNPHLLGKSLSNIIVTEGDILNIFKFGSKINLIVKDYTPKIEAVKITSSTKIKITTEVDADLLKLDESNLSTKDIFNKLVETKDSGLKEQLLKIIEKRLNEEDFLNLANIVEINYIKEIIGLVDDPKSAILRKFVNALGTNDYNSKNRAILILKEIDKQVPELFDKYFSHYIDSDLTSLINLVKNDIIKQEVRVNEKAYPILNGILRLSRKKISNIKEIDGFDRVIDLNELDLSFNQITKINGLEKLQGLTKLNLDSNKIKKIENLECLVNLKNLYLSRNQISRIEGLDKLVKIENLRLNGNKISQIEGIGNISNLKKLRIKSNDLPDYVIKFLGDLDRNGEAKAPYKFVEYSQLKEEGKIKTVEFENKTYEVLERELRLQNLGIKSIEEIKNLDKLEDLKMLDLSSNEITNLEGLEKLTSLKELNLQNNNITKLDGLKTLTSLKVLNLQNNKIEDPTGIEKIETLEELRLFGNNIYEITGIKNLKNLKILGIESKRAVSDDKHLKTLLFSLNMDALKLLCKQFSIKGYSKYKRDDLINFIMDSLADEEKREIIIKKEPEIIADGINIALRKIRNDEVEKIASIKVTNAEKHEVELNFRGFNWETTSYIKITSENINDPERDCDCRIGSNMGFCNHFWVGFIFSLKQGYFDLSDWTLTPLPEDFEKRVNNIKNLEKWIAKEKLDHQTKKLDTKEKNQWIITSSSDPNKTYQVNLNSDNSWSCTCPHFKFRKTECRHIKECKKKVSF